MRGIRRIEAVFERTTTTTSHAN